MVNSIQKQARWWNDRHQFAYHFSRSTYITVVWNWFMILASKAAEPFLFISVLYAGYKLIPSVSLPPANVDGFMFIAQMAALDIGGMGLMKIAQKEGLGRKSLAYRVGFILIVLMIATVVLATVERLFSIPSQWSLGIEAGLLIARAVMCVIYGYAIHAMRDEVVELNGVQSGGSSVQLNTEQADQLNTGQGVQLNTPPVSTGQSLAVLNSQEIEQVKWPVTERFVCDWPVLVDTHIGHPLNTGGDFTFTEYVASTVASTEPPAPAPVQPEKPVDVVETVTAIETKEVNKSVKKNSEPKKKITTSGRKLHVVESATPEQRIRQAYAEHGPEISDRKLAQIAHVSPATAGKWKEVIIAESAPMSVAGM